MNKTSVLIAEENSVVASNLEIILTSLGYKVISVVNSGEIAIKTAAKEKPDIVLMDSHIAGEMNGIEAANKIFGQFNIPVLLLTAFADKKKPALAEITTPFGYILKPVLERDLKSSIEMAININRKQNDCRQVKAALEQSEEKYRQIFENAQAPYVEVSLDGTILEISPSVNKYLSYKREELIGASILDFYAYPVNREKLIKRLHENKELVDEEIAVKDKDGSIRHAMLSSKYLPAEQKIVASLLDITDRKKAEHELRMAHLELEKQVEQRTEELKKVNKELHREIREHQHVQNALQHIEEKFRSLVESTSDWIWEIDREDRYTYSSPAVENLLGFRASEVYGKTPFDLLAPEEKEKIRAKFSEITRTKMRFNDLENIALHKDGHKVVLETSGVPILNEEGELMGYRGIDRDITRRKEIEKALIESQKNAEHANALKSLFLANISHELRTPMHHILSYAKFGVNKINKVDKEKLLYYFSQIRISGNRLLSLLNDLLDLSKLESGQTKYSMSKKDLQPIIENLISEFSMLAREKRLTFKFDNFSSSSLAFFDESKISQVIRNVFSNAVRYTPDERTVIVVLQRESLPIGNRLTDSKTIPGLKVSVIDEGTGIPENELEDIFDKFIQSSRTRSNAGGTGLGLSICKEIIKAHNGRIWAENNLKGGATFHFILPLDEYNARNHD